MCGQKKRENNSKAANILKQIPSVVVILLN